MVQSGVGRIAVVALSVLGMSILLVRPVSAHESAQERVEESVKLSSDRVDTHWRIFGGLSAGLGRISGQDYKNGPGGGLIGVNLLSSYEWPRWVVDGGVGWMYSSVNGQDALGHEIRIRTRSATADLSPRYRIGRFWQIGPALEMLFGADTAFGPAVGNSVGTLYGGARAVYETAAAGFPLRFLAQALTDFNVPGRQVSLVTTGIQFGIPIKVSRNAETQSVPSAARAADVLHLSHAAPIRLVLDPQQVFFGTNSSQLREPILEVLGRIGDFLATHPDQWGRVEVGGHADQRGSYSYNLKLSQRRAQSVRSALGYFETVRKRVDAQGYSFSRPQDPANNPKAWARNRRVEVVFYDVREPEGLLKLIRELPLGSVAQGDLK